MASQFPRALTDGEYTFFHQTFPNIIRNEIQVLGPKDEKYNCISYSLGFTDRWIDVGKTTSGLAIIYAHYFYEACTTPEATIDVYAVQTVPKHAAKVESPTKCSSKMQVQNTLAHLRQALEGNNGANGYGQIYGHFKKNGAHPGNDHPTMPDADHPDLHPYVTEGELPIGHPGGQIPIPIVGPPPATTLHPPPQPIVAAPNVPATAALDALAPAPHAAAPYGPAPAPHAAAPHGPAPAPHAAAPYGPAPALYVAALHSPAPAPYAATLYSLAPALSIATLDALAPALYTATPHSPAPAPHVAAPHSPAPAPHTAAPHATVPYTNTPQTTTPHGGAPSHPTGRGRPGNSRFTRMAVRPMAPYGSVPPPADEAVVTAKQLHASLKDSYGPAVSNFETLFDAWKATWNIPEMQLEPNSSARATGPAYDALVKLGPAIIPLIVKKLADPGNFFAVHLYNALEQDEEAKVDPENVLDHNVVQRHANLVVDINHARATAFAAKADAWAQHQEDNSLSANSTDYVSGEAYQSMVTMGPSVIGYALEKYAKEPSGWWHEMLHEIVHDQKGGPGSFFKDRLYKDWKDWFENGLSHEAAPKMRSTATPST